MPKAREKAHKSTYDICDELGISALTPSQWLRHAKTCLAIRKPIITLGRPGAGKTDLHQQLADDLNLQLVVERLNGKDPTDMGLPYVFEDNDGSKRHDWTIPKFLPLKGDPLPEGKKGWLIFIDELGQALPAMQNRIGEWINERMHNRREIHPDVYFAMAGNFPQDKAATYPIPRHIFNRASTVGLVPDGEDWRRWASKNEIRPEIIAFSKVYENDGILDSFDPDASVNCTARSLTACSFIMDQNPAYDDELALYSSLISKGWGSNLTGFLQVYRDLPRIEDIEKNPKKIKLPDDDRTDILCALAAMVGRALTPKNATPLVEFLTRLSAEYCVFALRDAVRRDPELKKQRALTDWAIHHGDVLT